MDTLKLVNFRVAPAEQAEWIKAAEADGRSLTSWVRHRLNKLAKAELAAAAKGDARKAAAWRTSGP